MKIREWQERLHEWAKTERKKIAGIPSTGRRAAYIWEYYKLWIIGIVFAVWFATFAIHQYTTVLHDYWCYMIFANTYAEVGDQSDLWDDYVAYAGFDLKEKAVVFNASIYFDYLKGVTGNSYFEAFVAYADSGTLDAITMGTESLAALGETGRLMDLESEACASIAAKYSDRFVYCDAETEDGETLHVAVGIDLSDSRLVTEYQAYGEPCALGIGALSDNVGSVELFLDFILQD